MRLAINRRVVIYAMAVVSITLLMVLPTFLLRTPGIQAAVTMPDSSATSFTPVSNVPPPTLIDPSDGARLSGLGALLKWTNPTTDTRWFQVQVMAFNNDGPGVDLIIGDSSKVAAAEYQVNEPNFGSFDPNYVMLPDMTYTWRVRTAIVSTVPMESEWSDWSSRTFRTAAKTGGTISASGPAMGSTVEMITPTLSWTSIDRTLYFYEVQVSRDRNFGTTPGSPFLYWELVHGGLSKPLNSYTISSQFKLEYGSTYYWRVRPRVQGDGAPVNWSNSFSFQTQPAMTP